MRLQKVLQSFLSHNFKWHVWIHSTYTELLMRRLYSDTPLFDTCCVILCEWIYVSILEYYLYVCLIPHRRVRGNNWNGTHYVVALSSLRCLSGEHVFKCYVRLSWTIHNRSFYWNCIHIEFFSDIVCLAHCATRECAKSEMNQMQQNNTVEHDLVEL